ncbi:MAG: DUF3192 domain-containing protein [Cyanosarcina radialis HA8281-LM2]|jgi:hypothetical protein|nr:DUF3192 domain-containing protein [Cyanosarcina radialis HA8281-LM2]
MRSNFQLNKWLIIAVLLVPLITTIATGCQFFNGAQSSNATFRSQTWKQATLDEKGNGPRCNMVEDLMKNHLRIGMSEDEVIEILGKPDFTLKQERTLGYALGRCGYSIDIDEFRLIFDATGKLQQFSQVQG